MTVFIVLGYDADWYEFETFEGVFSTLEKAKEFVEQDYIISCDEKLFNHEWYKILEIPIDKFNLNNFDDYVKEEYE